jgi:hypothetical protein
MMDWETLDKRRSRVGSVYVGQCTGADCEHNAANIKYLVGALLKTIEWVTILDEMITLLRSEINKDKGE